MLRDVGAFIEGPGFLPHLTGRQNLDAYWEVTGRPIEEAHLDEALAVAGLGEAVDRRVRGYSQGMRQRLGIAQAMLGQPSLLLLDEPTNGLDPPQINAMRAVLRDYAATGRTVVVSESPARRGRADLHPRGDDVRRSGGADRLGGRAHPGPHGLAGAGLPRAAGRSRAMSARRPDCPAPTATKPLPLRAEIVRQLRRRRTLGVAGRAGGAAADPDRRVRAGRRRRRARPAVVRRPGAGERGEPDRVRAVRLDRLPDDRGRRAVRRRLGADRGLLVEPALSAGGTRSRGPGWSGRS